MSSILRCPRCSRKLRVSEEMADKAFRCPACKTIVSSLSNRSPQEEELEEVREPEEEEPVPERRPRRRRPGRKKSLAGPMIAWVVGGVALLLVLLTVGGGIIWFWQRSKTAAEAEWQIFVPANGDCTVLMPGVPTPQTQMMLNVNATQYILERKNGREAFVIVVFDVQPQALRPTLMEEAANLYVKNAMDILGGGQASSNKPVTLSNIPGLEFQGKLTARKGTLVGRIYLAKTAHQHRAYLLAVFGESIQANTGDAARFLDSLKFVGPVTPPVLNAAPLADQPPPPANPPSRPPRSPRRQP